MIQPRDLGKFVEGFLLSALNSLQGALGKTSGRSYKAAPRQLLQVDSSASTNSDNAAGSATNGDSAGEDLAKNLNGASVDVGVEFLVGCFFSPGLVVEWGRQKGPTYIQRVTPDP